MDETSAPPAHGVPCTLCGDVNDGELFCRACGRARPVDAAMRCERCGTPDDGSQFCRNCGAPGGRLFEGAEPPPAAGVDRRRIAIAAGAAVLVLGGGALLLALFGVFGGSKSHPHTTAVQPTPTATTAPAATTAATTVARPLTVLRTISIAPLHALDAQNHCFGPAPRSGSPHVTLRLGGAFVENLAGKPPKAAFVLCGKSGDPSFASGIYRFRRSALAKGTRLGRLTLRFGIDESGGQVQAGAKVKLSISYYGQPACSSAAAGWKAPVMFLCDLSTVARPADLSRLQITQTVTGAKAPDVWAGLMSPRVTVLGRKAP